MLNSPGIRHRPDLKIGLLELAWLQDDVHRRRAFRLMAQMSEPGFMARARGNSPRLDYGWTLYDRDGDGILRLSTTVEPGELWEEPASSARHPRYGGAVDHDGNVIEIPLIHDFDIGITVPNDGTDYVIVLAMDAELRLERGTLNLTGSSTTITGTDTRFTDYIGGSDAANPTSRGVTLRIDAADTSKSNEGFYIIDTVVSDTELTVTSAPPADETGVPFRVAGEFLNAPAAPADYDMHTIQRAAWSLEADVIGAKSTDGLIAFRVRRTGGVTTLMDRRAGQLWRPHRREPASWFPEPLMMFNHEYIGGSVVAGAAWRQFAAGTNIKRGAVAPCSDGRLLLAWAESSSGAILTRQLDQFLQCVEDVQETATAVTAVSSSAYNPALVALPQGDPSGRTHLLFYEDGSAVIMRSTTDNGATWSGATTIWDVTAVDAADTIGAPAVLLTLDLRLIVVAIYLDDSAAEYSPRWVYSDDLGTTWEINSGAGWEIHDGYVTAVTRPSIAQDDGGRIYTAWTFDNAGPDRILCVVGTDPNDPTPADTAAATGDITISPPFDAQSGGNTTFKTPALWAAPDGGVICFYGGQRYTGTDRLDIWASSVYFGDDDLPIVVGTRHIRPTLGDGGSNDDWGGAVCQGADGLLHLVHIDGQVGGQLDWTPIRPVRLPRTRQLAMLWGS